MGAVVLLHSVHGVRPGVLRAAERLRVAGHTVRTPDRYAGHAYFHSYEEALAYEQKIGFPDLIARTEASVADLPQQLAYVGWSAGGALAEHLALTRPGALGVVLVSAAAKLSWCGAPA